MMTLVEQQIPWAMALLGVLLLAAGIMLVRRSRKGSGAAGPTEVTSEPVGIPPTPPEPVTTEPVAVPVGASRTYEGV